MNSNASKKSSGRVLRMHEARQSNIAWILGRRDIQERLIPLEETTVHVKFCSGCKTVWVEARIFKSEDFEDFGIRYCPYCSQGTDEEGNAVP